MKKEKQSEFVKFIQDEVGAGYPLRTILDNLEEEDIVDSIENYVKYINKKQNMKRLKFETQNELELFTLHYLVSKYDVPVSEINDTLETTIAGVAEEIAEYLLDIGFAKVAELECPEGCTGCDEPKSVKE